LFRKQYKKLAEFDLNDLKNESFKLNSVMPIIYDNLEDVPYKIQKSLIKFGFRFSFLLSGIKHDNYIPFFVQSVVDEILGSKTIVNMIEIDRLQWIEEALILCYNQYYPIEDYNSFFKNFNVFFKSQKNEKKVDDL